MANQKGYKTLQEWESSGQCHEIIKDSGKMFPVYCRSLWINSASKENTTIMLQFSQLSAITLKKTYQTTV